MAKNANRGRPEVLVVPQVNDVPEHPEMETKHPLEVMQMAAAKHPMLSQRTPKENWPFHPQNGRKELWDILVMAGDKGLTYPWDPSITS